jgi:hypothetical protein
VRVVIAAVEQGPHGFTLVKDWEIINRLNRVLVERDPRRFRVRPNETAADIQSMIDASREWLVDHLGEIDLPFRVPNVDICCVVLRGDQALPESVTDDVE